MRGNEKPMVIVVGAGPVGLATALSLHQRGIPVEIEERDERPGTHSYALALHPNTCKLLEQWGILERLEQTSLRIKTLVFCDKSGPRHRLDLGKIPGQEQGLLVVGQDHLENALIAPLEKARTPINWNTRLAGINQMDDQVEIQLEKLTETLSGYAMARLEWQVDKEISRQARFLIGADGHSSMVRRAIGIDFPRVAPTHSFAVFEFKTDFDHQNEARIVYTDEGANVMWPIPGGYCRWGFEMDPESAETYSRRKDRLFVQIGNQGYRSLESSMLRELLEKRAPWFNGSIEQFRWRVMVRFERRLAPDFGRGHVWLAGDAGHVTGPIGMQSMNIGMHEGYELANCIADCIERDNDRTSLTHYNAGRENEWKALLGISRHFVPNDDTPEFLAANAGPLFTSIPACKDTLPLFARALSMDLMDV